MQKEKLPMLKSFKPPVHQRCLWGTGTACILMGEHNLCHPTQQGTSDNDCA